MPKVQGIPQRGRRRNGLSSEGFTPYQPPVANSKYYPETSKTSHLRTELHELKASKFNLKDPSTLEYWQKIVQDFSFLEASTISIQSLLTSSLYYSIPLGVMLVAKEMDAIDAYSEVTLERLLKNVKKYLLNMDKLTNKTNPESVFLSLEGLTLAETPSAPRASPALPAIPLAKECSVIS